MLSLVVGAAGGYGVAPRDVDTAVIETRLDGLQVDLDEANGRLERLADRRSAELEHVTDRLLRLERAHPELFE